MYFYILHIIIVCKDYSPPLADFQQNTFHTIYKENCCKQQPVNIFEKVKSANSAKSKKHGQLYEKVKSLRNFATSVMFRKHGQLYKKEEESKTDKNRKE